MVPGAERKLREQRGLSSEYLVRTHQKSPGPPQSRGFTQPEKGEGKYGNSRLMTYHVEWFTWNLDYSSSPIQRIM